MIDPTHLRIGNIVQHKDEIITIDSIGSYAINIIAAFPDGGIDWEYHTEEIEPIPLTPEWLDKIELPQEFEEDFEINTFKNSTGLTEYWISKRTYCQECSDTIIVNELKYLHTLQNAIHALTGQELTIKP